jgi:hypothetical protein
LSLLDLELSNDPPSWRSPLKSQQRSQILKEDDYVIIGALTIAQINGHLPNNPDQSSLALLGGDIVNEEVLFL